jgi:TonB family protein
MLTILSNSPVLTSLSLTLLHFLWQGLLVAAVLKSALLIFNNNKPQLRYALSSLAMFVNLLLPIITFSIIYLTESTPTNTLASSLALSDLIEELNQPNPFFSYREFISLLPSLLPSIAILWLTTIAILASQLLLEIYNVNNLPQQNTILPSKKLQIRFNELIQKINLTIKPKLLISLKVDVPMAIGWLKPVVLLPVSMVSGLNTAQLDMLILHELAHIRRHDYLVNFFQTLVEILLFFHPAVHWVSKQMRNEREYCSDDVAVQHCGDAVAYAHTLADTASLCTKTHHHTIPDMAMAASGGDLKQRVFRLVDHHCAPKNNISKWFASLTIVLSILILSSKQLLTMPLLDVWYNEKPSHSANSVKTTSIKSPLTFQSSSTNKQNNNHPLNTTVIEVPLIISTQQTTPSDIALSNTQLKNSFSTVNQSIQLNNKQITTKVSSEIKQTIEPTLSLKKSPSKAKPYHQEVTKLAISPQLKIDKTKKVEILSSQNYLLLADSTSVNKINNNLPITNKRTKMNTRFVDHISRQKEESVKPNIIVNKSILPLTPVWQSAEQVKNVVPIYPTVAKRKGIEIDIKVDFTIDIDGQIKNIKFAQHKKINYFKKSIRKAIEKWRFLPAKVDEKPVESQMAKVFSFSLQS